MGLPQKVSDARLRATLKKHDGMQALTAKALGIARQTVHQRIQASPELQQFVADLDVQILDTAESQTAKKVRKGYWPAVRYVLDNKGKDRGYGRPDDAPPPPPPDNSKRALIVNVLVQNLNEKAQRVHVQLEDGQQNGALSSAPAKVLNGHAKPNGKTNGHG